MTKLFCKHAWSPDQIKQLVELIKTKTSEEVGAILGFSKVAVDYRLLALRRRGLKIETRGRGGDLYFDLNPEQIEWIRTNAAWYTKTEICAHLGLNRPKLRRVMAELGLTGVRAVPHWTPIKDGILRKLAGTVSVRALMHELGRSKAAIMNHAIKLGISVAFDRQPISASCIDEMREMVAKGAEMKTMMAHFGISYHALRGRLQKYGLQYTDRRSLAPVSTYREYTADDEALLRERVAAGAHLADLAFEFGRSRNALRNHLAQLGLRAARSPYAPRKNASGLHTPCSLFREAAKAPKPKRVMRVQGSVVYCPDCHCPYLDTPAGYAEHRRWIGHHQAVRDSRRSA